MMKSIMPWFCLVAVANVGNAFADEALDAYRTGHYKQAAKLFAQKPTQDPIVNYYMGRMRLYGYGELKDNTQALRYLKQSAEKGYLPAQNILARYALLHDKNPEQALVWFKKAAELNDVQAQMYCASAYLFGVGTAKNSDMAKRYYIAAAKAGNPIAQYTLAQSFLTSGNQGKTLGLIWLNKSVAQGNADAELLMARLYANGKFLEHDVDQAQAITKKVAETGYLPALLQMGELAMQSGNLPLAKDWYQKAANKQYNPAKMALAQLYLQEKSPLYNPHDAFLVTLNAAQDGMVEAQRALVDMYQKGIGVEKDENLATEWKKKAQNAEKNTTSHEEQALAWLSQGKAHTYAECGYVMPGILSAWQDVTTLKENIYNPAPQMNEIDRQDIYRPNFVMVDPNQISMSEYYSALVRTMPAKQDGLVIPRYSFELSASTGETSVTQQTNIDPSQAQGLFKKLENQAILGDSIAQFDIAQMYEHGIGVEKNINEAIKFYTLAARQQDLRAEYNLGLIYLEGQGVPQDAKKGISLLRDAAFKGNPYAQYVVASIDEEGYRSPSGEELIPADPTQAIAMYDLAAANNFGLAQYRLAQILAHEPVANLSIDAVAKRQALLKSLYQGAVLDGVEAAQLPLAFYNAQDANKTKQAQALSVVTTKAQAGDQLAALLLGLLYDRGIGVALDHDEAIRWYQKAGTNLVSAFILGSYMSQGKGMDTDLVQGKTLLEKSASDGFSYANLNLAILKHVNHEAFLPNLEQALALGNNQAGLLLADYYVSTNEDMAQLAKARDIYQQFADKGDKVAQFKLGYMFEYGLGGQADMPMAEKWYLASSQQDEPMAQYLLGHFYQLGRLDNKPNYQEAKAWYAKAQHRYAPAAVALGFIYETVDDDYEHAMQSYQVAASQNDPIGQYDLALMSDVGKGREVNEAQAQTMYLNAANQGFTPAMFALAQQYFSGSAGVRDEDEAIHWYKKAAQMGNQDAMYQLGLLSETGVGTSLNYEEAAQYYQQAAKLGDAQATLALARMYTYGLGVQKDAQQAKVLYETLAKQGNAYAQYQLALMYAETTDNVKETRALLQQAQNNGSQQARKTLQWLNAQKETQISFIEPLPLNPMNYVTDQSAELMYLNALNAWNHGDEIAFRMILSYIIGQYPNYLPAKRAYEQLTPGAWG